MAKKITSKSAIVHEQSEIKIMSASVTIIANEKSGYMVSGKEYQVPGILAENLIKKGFATLKN